MYEERIIQKPLLQAFWWFGHVKEILSMIGKRIV